MRCLYCGKRLSLLHKLSGREFCGDEHHSLYMQDQESLGLARLIEAKQHSKGTKRRGSKPSPAQTSPPPPADRFVTQFPSIQIDLRPAFAIDQQLPAAIEVALPAVDFQPATCSIRPCEPEVSVTGRLEREQDTRPDQPAILVGECALRYPRPPAPGAPLESDPPKPGLLEFASPVPKATGAPVEKVAAYGAVELASVSYPASRKRRSGILLPAKAHPNPGPGPQCAGDPPRSDRPAERSFSAAPHIPASLNQPRLRLVADAQTLRGLEDLVASFTAAPLVPVNLKVRRQEDAAEPEPTSLDPAVNAALEITSCTVPTSSAIDWTWNSESRQPSMRRIEAGPVEAVAQSAGPSVPPVNFRIETGAADPAGQSPRPRLRSAPVLALEPASPRAADTPERAATTPPLQVPPPTAEPTAAFLLPPSITGDAARGSLPSAGLVPVKARYAGDSGRPVGNEPPALVGSDSGPLAHPRNLAVSRRHGISTSARLVPLAVTRSTPPAAPARSRPVAVAAAEREFAGSELTGGWGETPGAGASAPARIPKELFPLSLDRFAGINSAGRTKADLNAEPVSPTLSMPRLGISPVKYSFAPKLPDKKLGPPVWQRIANPVIGTLRNTPTSVRWILMAIPLISALVWHMSNRQETVIADTRPPQEVTSALAVRWQNFQENVSSRAAISLADDFRGGLSDWTGNEGWSKSWAYDESGFVRPGDFALYEPSIGLADYQFEFTSVIEQGGINWVFRASDPKNYYCARLSIINPGPLPEGAIDWYVVVDGKRGKRTRTVLPFPLRNEKMYRIRLVAHGDGFTTFLDDRVVDFFEDDRLPTGGVGFFKSRGDKVRLRWISVIHQYDMLGRLCALIAPYDFQSATRSVTQ